LMASSKILNGFSELNFIFISTLQLELHFSNINHIKWEIYSARKLHVQL
jgi:hypothetical protein